MVTKGWEQGELQTAGHQSETRTSHHNTSKARYTTGINGRKQRPLELNYLSRIYQVTNPSAHNPFLVAELKVALTLPHQDEMTQVLKHHWNFSQL